MAADSNHPLVTEWSAADKAHLESLISERVVAVQYSGCELRIVPECELEGRYVWSLTTLATDTVRIASVDELYAKLPLGAAELESELSASGSLAVQTTVTGQLRLGQAEVHVPKTAACAEVTHWVNALSVGAFRLYATRQEQRKTDVSAGLEVRDRSTGAQRTVHEAGSRQACAASTDSGPDAQCASPIQLFLEPVANREQYEREALARKSGAVQLDIAPPEVAAEHWTLRDAQGGVLCSAPCEQWVTPASGYYLQRDLTAGQQVKLPLPASFDAAPGSRLRLEYRAQRGAPFTSAVLFYGLGVPAAIGGVFFTGLAINALATSPCDEDCQSDRSITLPLSLAYLATAGGLYYWYSWSHEARLEFDPADARSTLPGVELGAGYMRGRF